MRLRNYCHSNRCYHLFIVRHFIFIAVWKFIWFFLLVDWSRQNKRQQQSNNGRDYAYERERNINKKRDRMNEREKTVVFPQKKAGRGCCCCCYRVMSSSMYFWKITFDIRGWDGGALHGAAAAEIFPVFVGYCAISAVNCEPGSRRKKS